MSDNHTDLILQKSYKELRRMRVTKDLLAVLCKEGVINDDDQESILNTEAGHRRRPQAQVDAITVHNTCFNNAIVRVHVLVCTP